VTLFALYLTIVPRLELIKALYFRPTKMSHHANEEYEPLSSNTAWGWGHGVEKRPKKVIVMAPHCHF